MKNFNKSALPVHFKDSLLAQQIWRSEIYQVVGIDFSRAIHYLKPQNCGSVSRLYTYGACFDQDLVKMGVCLGSAEHVA